MKKTAGIAKNATFALALALSLALAAPMPFCGASGAGAAAPATPATPAPTASGAGIPRIETCFPFHHEYWPYDDLSGGEWFFESAELCQRWGIVATAGRLFDGRAQVTNVDALAVLLKVQEAYYSFADLEPRDLYGIYTDVWNTGPDKPINRECFASLLAAALPREVFAPKNDISEIPGYPKGAYAHDSALLLYRAGVFCGDQYGLFSPFRPLTRAELVTILHRVVRPPARVGIAGPFPANPHAAIRRVSGETEAALDSAMAGGSGLSANITFSDGLLYIHCRLWPEKDRYGVFDPDGGAVFPMAPGKIYEPGGEGKIKVFTLAADEAETGAYYDTGAFYYYDAATGKELHPQMDVFESTRFYSGIAAVREENGGDVSLIDSLGNVIARIPNTQGYDMIGRISGGYAHLEGSYKGNSHTDLISIETGQKIELQDPNAIGPWQPNEFVFLDGGFNQYGYAVACEYKVSVNSVVRPVFYNLWDTDLNAVLPEGCDSISAANASYAIVQRDGLWGVETLSGGVAVQFGDQEPHFWGKGRHNARVFVERPMAKPSLAYGYAYGEAAAPVVHEYAIRDAGSGETLSVPTVTGFGRSYPYSAQGGFLLLSQPQPQTQPASDPGKGAGGQFLCDMHGNRLTPPCKGIWMDWLKWSYSEAAEGSALVETDGGYFVVAALP
jgi:hypothetical protein